YYTCLAGRWPLNEIELQPDALLQHGFDRWCVWPGFDRDSGTLHERYWDPFVYLNRPVTMAMNGWPNRDLQELDWGLAGTFKRQFGPNIAHVFATQLLVRQ